MERALRVEVRRALVRHCQGLRQHIRRGFEELGESILVDGTEGLVLAGDTFKVVSR
jgi:hypothetical protein